MQIKDIPKLFRTMMILILAGIVLPVIVINAQPISAADNYARNRAGVVMVKTQLSAIVNVSQLQINTPAFGALIDSIQQLNTDSIVLTAEQKLDLVIARFKVDANRYFKSTLSYFRFAKTVTSTGTGFFFRGDGYVLTNCHVVDEGDNYIRRRFISSVFRQVTASNIKSIETSWQVNFTEAQRDELFNTFAGIYSRILPISLDSLKKSVYVVVAGDEESGILRRELPARVIVKGRSMPGKDVAILKVAENGPFPTISMPDNKKARVGERVFVYGFPETVTNNEYLSGTTALEPTLTNGIISAWKRTILNWPVMQMDASINHGNSGGPVCNEEGEVIGMTTFGSLEAQTGALAAGFNFAIPLSVLNEFFERAGIEPKKSELSLKFNEGLSFFSHAYYNKALERFTEVQKKYPYYPGISSYIEECRVNIENQKDKEPNRGYYLFFVGAVVLIVIISVIAVNVKRR